MLHILLPNHHCTLNSAIHFMHLQAVLALTGDVKSDPMEFQSVMIEQIADNARILKVPSQLALTWCQLHKHTEFADSARPSSITRMLQQVCLIQRHKVYFVHQYAWTHRQWHSSIRLLDYTLSCIIVLKMIGAVPLPV